MDIQYPIDEIRSQFPAFKMKHNGLNIIFLDGPSGSQVPIKVVESIADYLFYKNSNLGGVYPTSVNFRSIDRNFPVWVKCVLMRYKALLYRFLHLWANHLSNGYALLDDRK